MAKSEEKKIGQLYKYLFTCTCNFLQLLWHSSKQYAIQNMNNGPVQIVQQGILLMCKAHQNFQRCREDTSIEIISNAIIPVQRLGGKKKCFICSQPQV